ncbi:hypothetical protein V8F06_002550 [Rhypophila decipiens]
MYRYALPKATSLPLSSSRRSSASKRCLPNFRSLRSDKCSSKAFPSTLPQFDTQRARSEPPPSISSTHKRNTSFLGLNRNPPHFFSTFHRPANMPKWEEIRDDLFEAIMAVQPALGKEQQEQVVVFMQSRGHNMVWNAISSSHILSRHFFLFSKNFLCPRPSILGSDFNAISKATNSPSSFVIQDGHQNKLEIMSLGSKQHVWTTEAYKDVLMALNNHFCPNAADCRAIIGELRSKGWSYSDNALLQHLQKLRRKEGGAANGVNSGNDEAATPNKKGKRGPAAGAKKEKTPKRKPTKNAAPKDEDDSEDDLNYGPAPKKIKVENRDLIDDDDGDLPPLSGDV